MIFDAGWLVAAKVKLVRKKSQAPLYVSFDLRYTIITYDVPHMYFRNAYKQLVCKRYEEVT